MTNESEGTDRALLRRMFDDNVRIAGRMLDIGDTAGARRHLASADKLCSMLETELHGKQINTLTINV